MDRELLQGVCGVLDRAGFRMRDGDRGLDVEWTPEGVRIQWLARYAAPAPSTGFEHTRRGSAVLDYGQGARAALAVALTAVLEQAGYRVQAEGAALLITNP